MWASAFIVVGFTVASLLGNTVIEYETLVKKITGSARSQFQCFIASLFICMT